MTCKILNCENSARTMDMCPAHYQQHLRAYPPRKPADKSPMPLCSVSHCEIPAESRVQGSMCRGHYQVSYRGLDPETRIVRPDDIRQDVSCWVSECPKRAISKGLCNYHARRARQGQLEVPEDLGVVLNPQCSFESCSRISSSKGLCHAHYEQLREGRKLAEVRDWGKYVKGEHVCSLPKCRKPAVSRGLCEGHGRLTTKYRVSPERLLEIWTDPRCANPNCSATTRLHMDHDHDSGEFRDLLCGNCNTALGMLKDDPSRLRGLAEYIERF